MRRVVREIRIPAGRSVAQLQSPVARCRIRCTSVGVEGADPPTSPLTFGILTVTPWFPFLVLPGLYTLWAGVISGATCMSAAFSAPANASTAVRLQGRHVFDLRTLVLDVYVV